MAWSVTDNKRGFSKYTGDKTKTEESVIPLLNEMQDLVTQDREKMRYWMLSLPQSFLLRLTLRNPRHWRPEGKAGVRKMYPWWKWVRLWISKPHVHKSTCPDRMPS